MTTDEAREFFKFLNGEVPWNGTWFGEYAPGERGAYWWRKHLDEAIAALIAAPAAPQQAEPVAQIGWADEFGNLFPMGAWKPTQRTHHDSHKAAWRPVFLHPPADEVRLQGGLDNEELLEAWRTKVPGVEPTDSDLRAFALGVEFGTRGKRVYFDERNSARDAWRRRVKQCETLEAEVQRLRDALDEIESETQDVSIQQIARKALEGK